MNSDMFYAPNWSQNPLPNIVFTVHSNMNKFHKLENRGFTMIEILVSATIIAVLSTIGVTGYQAVARGGRDALRKSDLEQIRSALEIYKSENSSYPTATSCGVDNLSPDYINPYPEDPRGYSYCYIQSSPLTYELCAHLENGDPSDSYCGVTEACSGVCNYSVVNP